MPDVLWEPWVGPGSQHLQLHVRESGVIADGVVLGVTDGAPFRLAYEVRCDAYWRVRYVRVGRPGTPPDVELLSDGEGRWSSVEGRAVSYLDGCEYVDIADTPFTGRNRSATPDWTRTGTTSTGSRASTAASRPICRSTPTDW